MRSIHHQQLDPVAHRGARNVRAQERAWIKSADPKLDRVSLFVRPWRVRTQRLDGVEERWPRAERTGADDDTISDLSTAPARRQVRVGLAFNRAGRAVERDAAKPWRGTLQVASRGTENGGPARNGQR
jgi:hypothetical protein